MTTISDTIQSLSATTALTTEEPSTASSEEVMGKDDFLTLLVAQLQNQDPLDPDDATEFTAQLAQFSSLEQLMNLNESVDALAVTEQTSDQLSAMELIGKDVVYEGTGFEFNGEPVTIGYQLDGAASSVTMTIQNDNGATVSTLTYSELAEGNHFIEWDGLASNGDVLDDGQYEISVQASAGDGESVGVTALVQSEVTGVEFDADTGTVTLVTLAGTMSLDSILAAYDRSVVSASSGESTEDTDDSSEKSSGTESETVTDTTSSDSAESTLTVEEQIVQDSLQYYLTT
jgi:flagellar basal-body rod modification protein FlgD